MDINDINGDLSVDYLTIHLLSTCNALNGRSSGSNTWKYVSTIFLAIFCWDIPLHRPYIMLTPD